jgi:hypothetical protein
VSAADHAIRALMSIVGGLSDGALRAGSRALFSRSWRAFEHAIDHPRELQIARLLAIVGRARDTAFGKEHGFGEIRSFEDYRARVPVRPYEELEPYLMRMVAGEEGVLIPDRPYFYGRSSGTTGTPKYIPVTPMYVAEYRRPRRVWARQVMQAFPGLVRGKILTIHSPRIDGRTPKGIAYGSVTVGLQGEKFVERAGRGGAPWEPSPRGVFLVEDFDLKYYVMLRLAAQERIALAAAVNPSTLVLFAKKLDEFSDRLVRDLKAGTLSGIERLLPPIRAEVERRLRVDARAADRIEGSKLQHGKVIATELWPEIAGLLSWKGGSAPFYLSQLEALYPGKQVMDYGYLATEGGFSIPLSPEGASGVVAVSGHVLEFVEEGGEKIFLADELEVGKRYRVVITGCHGLYRYDINDVVECTGHLGRTAEIAFVHKGGNMLSLTGEKIGERHVVEAANAAERESGVPLLGFSVTVELRDPPRYLFGVEPARPIDSPEAEALLAAFERALMTVNLEYEAKRRSQRLGAPKLVVFTAGAFERERARKVAEGAPDSHVKPPHLAKDAALFARLGIEREFEA